MAGFIDNYGYLPQTVDIGGDIYFLGPEMSVKGAFKGRKQFQNTFGLDAEPLLRKYMNYSIQPKKKLMFDSLEDKTKLINILKKRANVLKTSNGFTSSTLKNEIFKKSYLYIQKLITDLEGSDGKSIKVDDEKCANAKKAIEKIDDDVKFQMILEMAWYLLHPDKVPSEIGCDWAKLVKELERLRVGDIVKQIHEDETKSGIEPSKNAFNYFKKINLQNVAKSDTIKNALDQAKQFATKIQDESAADSIKKRLKLLLEILEMKKYLAREPSRDVAISNDEMKTIERSMITNPMKGGALTLTKPLGIAMNPLFDYFKVVYDPIYSFLEKSITEYQKTNQIIIPQLTTLLHICNNLKSDTYGVYRITNVDKELLEFIKYMLNVTDAHIGTLSDDTNKNMFNKWLFKLPQVRLSSIPDEKSLITLNKQYKDPIKLSSIQFFIMGANINYLSNSTLKKQTDKEVKEFYKEGNIYMVYTESKNVSEQIPINVYDIDYNIVDVTDNNIKINNIPDNYFNEYKNELSTIYFENLVDIKKYVVYNNAELALSIFIALKELMPK